MPVAGCLEEWSLTGKMGGYVMCGEAFCSKGSRFDLKLCRKMWRLLVVLVSLLFPVAVSAECISSQICDDFGQNCRVRDLCSSITDLPSTNMPLIQPLPSTELKPLPALTLPPLGTSNCQYMQVNGKWRNVCH